MALGGVMADMENFIGMIFVLSSLPGSKKLIRKLIPIRPDRSVPLAKNFSLQLLQSSLYL